MRPEGSQWRDRRSSIISWAGAFCVLKEWDRYVTLFLHILNNFSCHRGWETQEHAGKKKWSRWETRQKVGTEETHHRGISWWYGGDKTGGTMRTKPALKTTFLFLLIVSKWNNKDHQRRTIIFFNWPMASHAKQEPHTQPNHGDQPQNMKLPWKTLVTPIDWGKNVKRPSRGPNWPPLMEKKIFYQPTLAMEKL